MQRYFFHVEHGELSRDAEGTLLPGLEQARRAAASLLGELLRDGAARFWTAPQITITVEDETGLVLWTIDTVGTAAAAVASLSRPGRR